MNIILLTGHRKSGTTMLHKLFDGHPGINIYPVDISLLYAYLPCQITLLKPDERRARIELVIRSSTAALQGKQISKKCLSFDSCRLIDYLWHVASPEQLQDPMTILSSLASAWCAYGGFDSEVPFVFKETSQSIHAYRMHSKNSRLKVIQIVRDPRDNYAAIKAGVAKYYVQMGESEKESLGSIINRARMDMLIGAELLSTSKKWFTAVRFEDLTQNLEESMRRIADFCQINFSPELLKPTILGQDFSGNSHDGQLFTNVSARNVNRWRERISDFEVGVIEFWMSDVMQSWGYLNSLDPRIAANAFSEFYNWYNCRYFYYDSYTTKA